MHFSFVIRTLGQLLTLFSFTMFPALLISLFKQDGVTHAFVTSFIVTAVSGIILWRIFSHTRSSMTIRDGLLLTVLFWITLSLFGAIPFYMGDYQLSIHDAVFESFSGFTTTGATVIDHIESLPMSILFYRQMLQWLGGMGIVVLAVAVLPMLGGNSILLFRAETPGPNKDSRITPKVANTAKILWFIYLGFTVACALAYYLAGMTLFDAVGHAFSTVAIGGFSTHDSGFAYFNNMTIEIVCIVFMILSAINYGLHFTVFSNRKIDKYWKDSEVKVLFFAILFTLIITIIILSIKTNMPWDIAIRKASFQVVSLVTTTGFTTDNFAIWPLALPMLLVVMSCVGGCTGSTCGGIKAMRILLLCKVINHEIKKLLHPRGVFTLKLYGTFLPQRLIEGVLGFFVTYSILVIIIVFILQMLGIDSTTAWSTTIATINNLGPALGDASMNYYTLPDAAKWILCFSMLLGRLEIFTLLAFISPLMWRY